MKKSKKAKAPEREDGGVDRISNLPDPILQLILSRLEGTEEVIRTSILSTRWKNLWTSVPSIDINCFRGLKPQIFKSNKFKEFVYWVLANKSLDLDRFRLSCLDYYSMSTLRRWIHIVVTKNVRYLDLVFCPRKKSVSVELPHCLVNCGSLEVLKLSLFGRRLSLPDSTGFRALAVLVLCKVELFGDYSVKCFFENLPVLEGLALFDCYTHKLYSLNISCPNLKSLTIRSREGVSYEEFCKGKGMCSDLVISCPKLAVLDLRGYVASVMSFEGLDSLWDVQIHPQELDEDEQPLTDGFDGLRNVVAMSISLYTIAMCYYPPEDTLVSLPNLKLLELTTGVFTMAILIPFLKCLPDLESLHLIISWVDNLEDWKLDDDETMGILTRCLKSVDFLGFDGDERKVVVARSLLEHGNHLKEMVFAWYVEDEHHDKSIKAIKEIEIFHKASSTVKFRCTEL